MLLETNIPRQIDRSDVTKREIETMVNETEKSIGKWTPLKPLR